MEDLLKKRTNVEDANGWYLVEPACRKWNEDFVDEDTGEVVSIERNEIIYPAGEQLTPISISMLQVNGVSEVLVSNKKITGAQQKYMSLWQLECVSYDKVAGKDKSDYYIIPKGSPLECEVFFKEWADLKIEGLYTIKKVVPLDFSRVLLPYVGEAEEAVKKRIDLYFYKATVKPLEGASSKILVLADSIRTVEAEVELRYRNTVIDRITEVKEMNVKEFFEEGLNVDRYLLGSHNPHIGLAALDTALDKITPEGTTVTIEVNHDKEEGQE